MVEDRKRAVEAAGFAIAAIAGRPGAQRRQ